MKKFVLFGFVLLALALLLPGVALAGDDGKGPGDQPYWGMLGEDNCSVPNFGYNNDGVGYELADSYWAFYLANGNWFVKCVGHLDYGVTPPASEIDVQGLWCYWPGFGYTNDTHVKIDTNGEIRATCKFK